MGVEASALKLLVVDDDVVDVESVRRGVRRLGLRWSIRAFENGRVALRALRRRPGEEPIEPPYVILLDLNMPQMDGLEFLRELRADPGLARVPVFLLSTSTDGFELEAARRLGIDGCIPKAEAGEDYVDALAAVRRRIERDGLRAQT